MKMSDENTPLLTDESETFKPSKRKSHSSSRKFKFIILPTLLLIILIYSVSKYVSHNQQVARDEARTQWLLHTPLKLRLYTNNIRFDNINYPDKYEKPWTLRKKQVINSIDFNTALGHANIVCLQEVLDHQLHDILDGLNKNNKDEWTYYGVGRTDGLKKGEYAPVLYKKSDWLLLDNQTFWLSETPERPSKGWDAALERIVTMVTLQSHINPLIKINVFNTHFDHRGRLARKRSAQLIVDRMENYNGYPSFLCGDFNTEPSDQPYHVLTKAGFKDSRLLIDKDYSYGDETTFTGFDKDNEPESSIIDYIWSPYFSRSNFNDSSIPEEDKIQTYNYYNLDHHLYYDIGIKQFGILHNFFKGFHFSDHRPVAASYEIRRTRLF
ncbi:Endonuclease/exonuclease/phosphatase [Scheffersomyces xylosifermentans]|uniref:Endonuclease/exonuclease/phosphatase n=1 Tax=Scheffersomyces xylosifermentans TaxID=1304137 RepID=UPI00315D3137